MTNDEIPKSERNPKPKLRTADAQEPGECWRPFVFRHSGFILYWVFRHSSFVLALINPAGMHYSFGLSKGRRGNNFTFLIKPISSPGELVAAVAAA